MSYDPSNVLSERASRAMEGRREPYNVIGVATSEPGRGRFASWFARSVWHGLSDAADEFGQDILFFGRATPDRHPRDGSGYLGAPVDGIIVIAPQRDAPALRLLSERNVPLATVAGDTGLPYPSFGSDNVAGVRQAVAFLRQLGHTRIAHVAGPSTLQDGMVRERAFREYMEERRLEVPDSYIQKGAFVFEGGYAAGQSLLRMPNRPTAVFAANDGMAYGLMAAAHDLGIDVPTELSVIGFDDDDHAAYHRPPLTTVRQPAWEAGREAMKALLEIVGGRRSVESRILPTELIVRDSTAPVSL